MLTSPTAVATGSRAEPQRTAGWTPPATRHGKKPEDTPSLQEEGCRPGQREPETPSLPETLQLGHRHGTRPESHVHRAPPHQVNHRGSAQPTSQETMSPLFMATADKSQGRLLTPWWPAASMSHVPHPQPGTRLKTWSLGVPAEGEELQGQGFSPGRPTALRGWAPGSGLPRGAQVINNAGDARDMGLIPG